MTQPKLSASSFPLTGAVIVLDQLAKQFLRISRNDIRQVEYNGDHIKIWLSGEEFPYSVDLGDGVVGRFFGDVVSGVTDIFWQYNAEEDQWYRQGEVVVPVEDKDEE
jgi:hypothetical protein